MCQFGKSNCLKIACVFNLGKYALCEYHLVVQLVNIKLQCTGILGGVEKLYCFLSNSVIVSYMFSYLLFQS